MRAILILSALCVSHVAVAADTYSVPVAGVIDGVEYRVSYGHVGRQTAYGKLYSDHVMTSDGRSYDTCELVFVHPPHTVEADCTTGKPQQ